jgi:hypothetical protein
MNSPIVAFYQGAGLAAGAYSLPDILVWDDGRLEASHDVIQWLFPLPEPSLVNPHAPILTQADIALFRTDAGLRRALLVALARMRSFYGLPGNPARHAAWLTPGNHNLLRLSRILRSLHLLGLDEEATALLRELEALYEGGAATVIGPSTLGYWRRAVV